MRTTSTLTLSGTAAAVLESAVAARRDREALEVRILTDAIEWAQLHRVDELDEAAQWVATMVGPIGVALGGEGVPLIAEWCVAEFATAMGLSHDSGAALFAEALELHYRLPGLWARVRAGEVATWRARRIANETLTLSIEAAEFVDRQIANYAHSLGPAAIERLVTDARWRFDPEQMRAEEAAAQDSRYFTIDHQHVSHHGTSHVYGELELADALDLEKAVSLGAEQLKRLGYDGDLDLRRAKAVGELARRQLAFGFDADGTTESGTGSADPQQIPVTRQVLLHLHLAADAVTGVDRAGCAASNAGAERDGAGFGRLENTGTKLITAQQVAEWCGIDAARVWVRPVIDLNDTLCADSYEIPDRIREQVILRDRHCVFPHCTRAARTGDVDHIIPWADDGPTTTENLAALCRKHHVLKTHHGWGYRRIGPAAYEWTSPYGRTYRVDPTGTTPTGSDGDETAARRPC